MGKHNKDAEMLADCAQCVADGFQRSCCPTTQREPHSSQCPSHGHMVERVYGGAVRRWRETDLLPPGPILVISEDDGDYWHRTHPNGTPEPEDLTFENETSLNPRKARKPRPYDDDWLF